MRALQQSSKRSMAVQKGEIMREVEQKMREIIDKSSGNVDGATKGLQKEIKEVVQKLNQAKSELRVKVDGMKKNLEEDRAATSQMLNEMVPRVDTALRLGEASTNQTQKLSMASNDNRSGVKKALMNLQKVEKRVGRIEAGGGGGGGGLSPGSSTRALGQQSAQPKKSGEKVVTAAFVQECVLEKATEVVSTGLVGLEAALRGEINVLRHAMACNGLLGHNGSPRGEGAKAADTRRASAMSEEDEGGGSDTLALAVNQVNIQAQVNTLEREFKQSRDDTRRLGELMELLRSSDKKSTTAAAAAAAAASAVSLEAQFDAVDDDLGSGGKEMEEVRSGEAAAVLTKEVWPVDDGGAGDSGGEAGEAGSWLGISLVKSREENGEAAAVVEPVQAVADSIVARIHEESQRAVARAVAEMRQGMGGVTGGARGVCAEQEASEAAALVLHSAASGGAALPTKEVFQEVTEQVSEQVSAALMARVVEVQEHSQASQSLAAEERRRLESALQDGLSSMGDQGDRVERRLGQMEHMVSRLETMTECALQDLAETEAKQALVPAAGGGGGRGRDGGGEGEGEGGGNRAHKRKSTSDKLIGMMGGGDDGGGVATERPKTREGSVTSSHTSVSKKMELLVFSMDKRLALVESKPDIVIPKPPVVPPPVSALEDPAVQSLLGGITQRLTHLEDDREARETVRVNDKWSQPVATRSATDAVDAADAAAATAAAAAAAAEATAAEATATAAAAAAAAAAGAAAAISAAASGARVEAMERRLHALETAGPPRRKSSPQESAFGQEDERRGQEERYGQQDVQEKGQTEGQAPAPAVAKIAVAEVAVAEVTVAGAASVIGHSIGRLDSAPSGLTGFVERSDEVRAENRMGRELFTDMDRRLRLLEQASSEKSAANSTSSTHLLNQSTDPRVGAGTQLAELAAQNDKAASLAARLETLMAEADASGAGVGARGGGGGMSATMSAGDPAMLASFQQWALDVENALELRLTALSSFGDTPTVRRITYYDMHSRANCLRDGANAAAFATPGPV